MKQDILKDIKKLNSKIEDVNKNLDKLIEKSEELKNSLYLLTNSLKDINIKDKTKND